MRQPAQPLGARPDVPAGARAAAGLDAEVPVAGVGPRCMAAAAQLMMMRTLVAELRTEGLGVRVNELVLGPVQTPARPHAKPKWRAGGCGVGEPVAWLASDAACMVSGAVIHLDQRLPVTWKPYSEERR